MKSADLSLGINGFIQIEHLGAKWSRNSVVTQGFLSCPEEHPITAYGSQLVIWTGIARVIGWLVIVKQFYSCVVVVEIECRPMSTAANNVDATCEAKLGRTRNA